MLCPSVWLSELDKTGSDAVPICALDEEAQHKVWDYVVIGSGMTGSSFAYHLSQVPGPRRSCLVLEQRELSGGASGRNGRVWHATGAAMAREGQRKARFGLSGSYLDAWPRSQSRSRQQQQ